MLIICQAQQIAARSHSINLKNIKDVWAGDSQIKFFESPFEEVADLGPVEAQAAFFFSMGLTITGGKVIHKYV
jgi:acetoacetate decarboxylase